MSENTHDILSDKTPEEQQMIMELAEQLLKMTKQQTKKVAQASEEDWDKIKKSEHIVTLSKELKAKTKTTKTMEDLEALIDSAKSKKHLTGTIVGVRSIDLGDIDKDGSKAKALEEAKKRTGNTTDDFSVADEEIKTWVAEIQFGNDTCQVLIPSYQLYPYKATNNRTLDAEMVIHRHMQDMVGAEIEFVVKHVNKGKKLAFASRLQALDDNGWGNYVRQTRSGKPRIKEGSIAEGRVVAIRNHAVIIDVGGAETTLQANREVNNISWSYVPDCHELFKINDIIPVKVLEVNTIKHKVYNESYNIVSIRASLKETTPNPIEEYWTSIHEGEIGIATVTKISDARCFCKYKNRVDILCKTPTHGAKVMEGDVRKVQITIKKDEPGQGKRIFGMFIAE